MDIIPKFYIFGVPDGFDMLGGTSAEITYFQKFYNGSTENAKFSIHRDAKGNITYTYLRYNLSSCKSRTGSFFGMSLIFSGVYCANPLRLYELFDWVYNTYIVSDKGFITPVNGSKDIQARYEIARFQDKSDYIQHYIEAVLLGNIKKEFSNEFYSIDSTFNNERPNLVVQEPMQSVSNERLLADLRQYNRVAVSPDWLPQTPPLGGYQNDSAQEAPTVVLAPEYIVSLLEYTKGYQNYIIDSLNDIGSADIDEAKAVYREVAARLTEVKTTPSSDKRVSQIIRDYTTLTEQLQNLIQKIEEGPTPQPQSPIPPTPPTPWWKNPKILGITGVSLAIIITLTIGLISALNKQQDEVNDRTPYIEQKIRTLIEDKEYNHALTLAEDSLKGKMYRHFADTIQDIQILQCMDDTLSKVPCYSFAWELSKKLNDRTIKDNKQNQLKEECTNYLQQETDAATTKQQAQGAKALINNCKVPIDSTKKEQMLEKLNKIINLGSNNTGGENGIGAHPKATTQYRVVLNKANTTLKRTEGADIPFTKNGNITGTNFVYHLEFLNSSNVWKPVAPDNIQTSDDSQFKKEVPAFGQDWYGIKLVGNEGTITVSKGNFRCTKTIKK